MTESQEGMPLSDIEIARNEFETEFMAARNHNQIVEDISKQLSDAEVTLDHEKVISLWSELKAAEKMQRAAHTRVAKIITRIEILSIGEVPKNESAPDSSETLETSEKIEQEVVVKIRKHTTPESDTHKIQKSQAHKNGPRHKRRHFDHRSKTETKPSPENDRPSEEKIEDYQPRTKLVKKESSFIVSKNELDRAESPTPREEIVNYLLGRADSSTLHKFTRKELSKAYEAANSSDEVKQSHRLRELVAIKFKHIQEL